MLELIAALILLAAPAAASDLESALAHPPKISTNTFKADSDTDVEPTEPLENFHQVSPGLYRSAQPTIEGYKRLKALGVKTVLTLKESASREIREANAEGLIVENVPMSGFHQPSFEQLDRALAILQDPSKRPLDVHCQRGKDRTGFVIASYRVVVEGVDAQKAADEAKSYGCCFFPFGDLAHYLKAYKAHRAR